MHLNKQVYLNKFDDKLNVESTNDNSNKSHNFYNDQHNLNELNHGDQHSSLDYLYQAISIIETKQNHLSSQSSSPTCSRAQDSIHRNLSFGVESNNYLNAVGKYYL
jgi:hypothetical protein